MNKKVIVFGTRPEFIKLLPLIIEINNQGLNESYLYVFTGQHTILIEDLFIFFDFKPTYALQEKDQRNSLSHSFSHILSGIQEVITTIKKTHLITGIIGQGDTTSCTCAALCAFFNQIPFFHVEAGLRTNNITNPFPEELFRKIITLSSNIHFAPTIIASENLLREGIPKENIFITGNTIVDAIEIIKSKLREKSSDFSILEKLHSRKLVLITCHRRENQNEKFIELIETIKSLAIENKSMQFIWISHETPYVKSNLTNQQFAGINNVLTLSPISIFALMNLYQNTVLIITDSGGIQEEAPSFNIPVILIRDECERPESIIKGYALKVGINKNQILEAFNQMINQEKIEMLNPYGNGIAATTILKHLNNIE